MADITCPNGAGIVTTESEGAAGAGGGAWLNVKIFGTCFILVQMAVSVLADDLKLSDGREYKGVTVTRVEPDGIMVMTDSGIEKIPFSLLPREIQQKYHYDPQAAAGYAVQVAQVQHQLFQAQEKAQEGAANAVQQAQQAENAAKEEAAKPRVRIIGNIERVDDSGLLVKYYLNSDWVANGGNVALARSSHNRPQMIEKFGEYFITGHPKQGELVDGNGIDVDAIPDGSIHTGAGETFAKFKVIKAYDDPFR